MKKGMKDKMKREIAFLLAGVMMLGLTACGKGGSGNE